MFVFNEVNTMTTAERIYRHAQHLPEAHALEVLDFIDFLQQKKQTRQVTTDWKTRLCNTPGIQWNGLKPSGGDSLRIDSAKTVAERVLEDRI
jgi:hypothetical protein